MFSEWKYVGQTKGLLKIVLGILLVPTFYAVIFLASLWNPYANVRHLPVGIVNEDRAVTSHQKRYALGTQVTTQLVANHTADFHQLSAQQAQSQLKSGQLYMAITIPANFSKRALALGTATTQPITLNYHTNAGFSFIAMKMNTTTAKQVQTKLDQQLATSYLTVMANVLKTTGRQLTTTGNDLTKSNRGLTKIKTGSQTTSQALTQVATGSRNLSTGLDQLTQGAQQSQTASTQVPQLNTALQQAMTTAINTQRQLTQRLTATMTIAQQFGQVAKSGQLKQAELQAITQQLQANLTALQQLSSQPALNTAAKLVTTTTSLTTKLASTAPQTQQALQHLATGATVLQQSTAQLATGSQHLTAGVQAVTTANQKIATGLTTGGDQLAQTGQLTTHQLKTIVAPIKLTHTDTTPVPNNGTGMSPYLMAVALFVGCITFNIIYDMYTPHRQPKNAWDWWRLKLPFLFEFTWLAATVMFGLLRLIDHLNPLHPWLTYAFCVLTMWTFGSIVTFFNLILDKTGAWLMLIFMIIQLGGSAGTYPIQLSNHLFQAIHPYLPMSIAIDAFRSTLSIGNSIWPETLIFTTIIIGFNLLMVLTFHYNLPRLKQLLPN
ncbi:YhgE/Pip domain-containing protein [Lactiplantibacillus daowaiensis]|uniref:YhgE/Pip family protein n=1 Tax=Lactiplantibacillus daowaiensis TaxID=2559918 RepID=A0ABW1S079_9LACO|nr:YhgE/Pip domain-containing protein [Lactiplantibacillus daowaiensis]